MRHAGQGRAELNQIALGTGPLNQCRLNQRLHVLEVVGPAVGCRIRLPDRDPITVVHDDHSITSSPAALTGTLDTVHRLPEQEANDSRSDDAESDAFERFGDEVKRKDKLCEAWLDE